MANNRYKLYRLHADGEFHGVIDATARIAADYIQDESPDTAHHAQRVALATMILDEDAADGSPERRRAIRHFALQAALNGDVLVAASPDDALDVSRIPDDLLDYIVAVNWNDVAGRIFPDLAESEG